MRATPSRLLAAAKDLIERQQRLGLPLPQAFPELKSTRRGARGIQREARERTAALLQRIAPSGRPKA